MAFRRIPQEAEPVAHAGMITTKGTKVHEGKQPGAAVPTFNLGSPAGRRRYVLKSRLRSGFPRMPDENARQTAEDHYYAALDLMADGALEKAVAAYRESLAADPSFTEAMHGLARALQDLQLYDDAIVVAQRIAEI